MYPILKVLVFCILMQFIPYHVHSQECNAYVPFVKGFSSETQLFRKNKKPNGRNILTVTDVQSTDGGKVATIEVKEFDPKDKPIGTGVYYNVSCLNGVTKINARDAMSGMPNLKFTEGACFTELPVDIQVGLTFENCQFFHSDKGLNVEVQLNNRKVTNYEVVTVGAGTFNTFVIEYDMLTKMTQNKIVMAVFVKHHRDWYAPGIGLVKSENYQPKKPHNKPEELYKPSDEPLYTSEMIAFK